MTLKSWRSQMSNEAKYRALLREIAASERHL